jgi:hypothetical protein
MVVGCTGLTDPHDSGVYWAKRSVGPVRLREQMVWSLKHTGLSWDQANKIGGPNCPVPKDDKRQQGPKSQL